MKVVLYLVILFLIIAVGYEAKQIEELKQELIKKEKEPKVVVHIEKIEPAKQNLQSDTNKSLDEVIKSDFQKIFRDIFGNKEVKEGIKQSITEFKKGLNQAISQLQKQAKELDKIDGDIFNDLIKEFGAGEFKTFEDKGDYYSYTINVDDEKSKVDINAKNGFLYIDISSKDEKKDKNTIVKKESKKSLVLSLPKDAILEKIKSEYKDKKLIITIPKIKNKVNV